MRARLSAALLSAAALAGCVRGDAVAPPAADGSVRVARVPAGGAVPGAVVDAAGVVHAAWVGANDVWYAASRDGGQSWGFPSRVNPGPGAADEPGMFRGPSIAFGRGGRVHVAWYPLRRDRPASEWGVRYSRVEATPDASASAWSLPLSLVREPADGISVAADPTGAVIVSWVDENGLRIARSSDGGDSFGAPETVAGADPVRSCVTRGRFLPGGEFLLLYRDRATPARHESVVAWARGLGIHERRTLSSKPWPEDACPTTGGWLSVAGDGAVAAWETGEEITWARLDGRGRIAGAENRTMAAGGRWPVAIANPSGLVCVGWKEGGTLCWQVFGADGRPLGLPQSRSSTSPHGFAAVVLPAGDFLLLDAG